MMNQPKARGAAAEYAEDDRGSGQDGFALSGDEHADVEEKRPPRPAVLHEIIRREGEQELARGLTALGLSSVAAGLSMGFSMLARGLLHSHLPDFPGRILIEDFGYCLGFLVVILARQQLFTENTMTAVLPLMTDPGVRQFGRLLRLWSVVLLGNLVGAALFAYGIQHMQQIDSATSEAFASFGKEVMQNPPLPMFTKGILAGWLIATLVWLLPSAENSKVAVIVIMTYVIAIGGFTHIIVGSIETLYLVFAGDLTFSNYALRFALPTLAGNIVGGSFIFALISHAQVRSDTD